MTKVGAVVLLYRGWPEIAKTLDRVLRQLPAEQVVVVDNASGDGSADKVREAFPDLQIVASPNNGGYAAGMRMGLAHRRDDDFTFLLTHECLLEPGAVDALSAVLESDGIVACAAPVLGRTSTGRVWSAGGVIKWKSGQPRHRHADESLATVVRGPNVDVEWADGAALMIRRSALAAIGGLDERYFLYNEEVDLAVRLRAAGWRIRLVTTAVAWQEPGPGGMPPYLEVRNRLLLWRRNGRPFLLLSALLFSAYQVVLDLSQSRPVVARLRIRGFADGLTGRLNKSAASARHRESSSE